MSYNPYANASVDYNNVNRLHHPQPQQSRQQVQQDQYGQFQGPNQQQQSYGYNQFNQQGQYQAQGMNMGQQQQQGAQGQFFNPSASNPNPNAFTQIFNDPKAAMTFQVGQNAMMAGSQYMEQELHKYIPTGTFKYYFKVSNDYVLKKVLLILFPFKNKIWTRTLRQTPTGDSNNTSGLESYAFPFDDTNAPDYYIPLMGTVTYIILTAMLAGLRNEFSPALLGNQWTMTIAYLLIDLAVLKGGIYMLGISSNVYDLIAYVGYKFVPLLIINIVKNVSPIRYLNWIIYIYLIIAYGFFELRAIRFNLFGGINSPTQAMGGKALKNSNYFLFLYTFIGQSLLIWALSLYC